MSLVIHCPRPDGTDDRVKQKWSFVNMATTYLIKKMFKADAREFR
jgi:hypothetical protein